MADDRHGERADEARLSLVRELMSPYVIAPDVPEGMTLGQ
jgi:hypothetical protein